MVTKSEINTSFTLLFDNKVIPLQTSENPKHQHGNT